MFHQSEIAQYINLAQKGILAEVVFGNPQVGCRNMGVCKVHIGPRAVIGPNALKTNECSCSKSIAFLRLQGENKLYFHFLNYSLSPKQYEKFFPGGDFVIEAPLRLPSALGVAFGLGEQAWALQAGHYRCHNDGMYHTVLVDVTLVS